MVPLTHTQKKRHSLSQPKSRIVHRHSNNIKHHTSGLIIGAVKLFQINMNWVVTLQQNVNICNQTATGFEQVVTSVTAKTSYSHLYKTKLNLSAYFCHHHLHYNQSTQQPTKYKGSQIASTKNGSRGLGVSITSAISIPRPNQAPRRRQIKQRSPNKLGFSDPVF